MDNERDTEGLTHLRWSMFDSPDSEGSGYLFMEREPVYILDVVCKMYRDKTRYYTRLYFKTCS